MQKPSLKKSMKLMKCSQIHRKRQRMISLVMQEWMEQVLADLVRVDSLADLMI